MSIHEFHPKARVPIPTPKPEEKLIDARFDVGEVVRVDVVGGLTVYGRFAGLTRNLSLVDAAVAQPSGSTLRFRKLLIPVRFVRFVGAPDASQTEQAE